jgi:diguanylate cyclase (GGDEF)-like protein
MSITDPLTGIYNRGYINERLPQEIRRAHRYGRDLTLVLCDIDHFKRVNDTHGHLAGDVVLKSFGRLLAGSIREKVDWAGRYGGEEFLLVLPETHLDGALVLVERIRATIETTPIETSGKTIGITSSFGVVCFSPGTCKEAISPEALLQEVDRLLYRAKNQGRNRIESGRSIC